MLSVDDRRLARAEARRHQVVDAARCCFQRFGFHGASMAQVAAAACMSVGQIYRFFPSKDAIIEAIVQEQVEHKIGRIEEIERAVREGRRDLADPCTHLRSDDVLARFATAEIALRLEILAEAARNPAVAAILQRADARVRRRAEEMIAAARPNWPPERVADACTVIATLVDGNLMRAVCDPAGQRPSAESLRAKAVALILKD